MSPFILSIKTKIKISKYQTRRRFGGRQPLCGIGVTSRIDLTSMPIVCSARMADSRPAPGPLTLTSTLRMPNAFAAFPAEIAAIEQAFADAALARRDFAAFGRADLDRRVRAAFRQGRAEPWLDWHHLDRAQWQAAA